MSELEKDEIITQSNVEQVNESEKVVKKKNNFLGYVKNALNAVTSTFLRFPLTIIFCLTLAVIAIYRMEMPYEKLIPINDYLDRIMLVLALGIPLSLSIDVLIERFYKKINLLQKLGCYILELALLVTYYYFVLVSLYMVTGVRHFCIIASLVLSFLFVPYLLKKENYEIYITKLLSRAITTGFFAVVLGTGIMAILFAIQKLLIPSMDSKFYEYEWILVWALFAPIYFLYWLPKTDESFNADDYTKILKVLLLYIVMPLIAVYTLVLYIYFGKIMITRVWPNGIVSYLVLSYTAVGIATVLLITPLKEISNWVRKFISVYTKLIFPLLIMMFVSIGIRIGEFGITENRYFIIIIGLWATLAMIYINFNKGRRNIILPISLAIIAIISVVGPLSSFNISKISQNNRFNEIITRNNMIQDGKIINNANVSDADKKEIYAIIDYFNYSHGIKELKYIPDNFDANNIEELVGFKRPDYYYVTDNKIYINYSRPNPSKVRLIKGYDGLFNIYSVKYDMNNAAISTEELIIDSNKIKVEVDTDFKMNIYKNETLVYQKDLNTPIKDLYNKYGNNYKIENFNANDLTYVYSDDKVDLKIELNSIAGSRNTSSNNIETNNFDGYLFLKVK